MLLEIDEARDALRIDGPDNDEVLNSLLTAVPIYLEEATGKNWEDEERNELAKTTATMILRLWYDPNGEDSRQLKRTVDTLLVALTTLGREIDG